MQTVATRVVRLDIAKILTVEDAIRTSIGPIKGSGDNFTFIVPPDVEEGDLMVVIASNRTHHTDAEVAAASGVFEMGMSSYTSWTAYTDTAATVENGVTYANKRLGCESFTRIAGASEAGTEYTFTYLSAAATYYWYFLAFKNQYISDAWEITSGFNDLDGFGDTTQTNFYVDSITIAGNTSVLLIAGAINGNVRTTPPVIYKELADVGDSNVSIFIMARMINAGASGIQNAYMESIPYFVAIGLEIQPV